jgi:hypothetical protein
MKEASLFEGPGLCAVDDDDDDETSDLAWLEASKSLSGIHIIDVVLLSSNIVFINGKKE